MKTEGAAFGPPFFVHWADVPGEEAGDAARRTASKAPAKIDSRRAPTYEAARAQVAELVDALVSGTSGASREGSSPFLGTISETSL